MSIATYAKCVCDTIDVIEPGSDERDLENRFVVKASRPEAIVITRMNFCCVAGQLDYVIQHEHVRFANRSLFIVIAKSSDEVLIESHLTQKLCVRFRSVKAVISERNDRGYHLVLGATERQIGCQH